MSHSQSTIETESPVRTRPLPLEFPGVYAMGDEEIDAVTRVLRARSPFRYYGLDPQQEAALFEEEFARYIGVAHAVAVSSGTGALHVALSALGVGPGQEVIIPAYLWISLPAAIVNRGAIPVLADIDDTFCMDPSDLEKRITPRTKAVIMPHMSGAPGDAPAVAAVARKHGLFLLEDCAQAAGSSIDGRKAGTFGDMAIFSFQMNKNMTAGEGGCVVTSDEHLYQRVVACHDLGYPRDSAGRMVKDRADLCLWGMGYRMDELRASVLRVQLRRLPQVIQAMRHSKYRVREAISALPGITLRRIPDAAGDTGCFLLATFEDAQTAAAFNRALRAEGIVTGPQGISNILMTSWGMHVYYNNLSLVRKTSVDASGFPWSLPANAESHPRYEKGTCPVADGLFERTILLAIPSCLTAEDEDDIITAFRKVAGGLL